MMGNIFFASIWRDTQSRLRRRRLDEHEALVLARRNFALLTHSRQLKLSISIEWVMMSHVKSRKNKYQYLLVAMLGVRHAKQRNFKQSKKIQKVILYYKINNFLKSFFFKKKLFLTGARRCKLHRATIQRRRTYHRRIQTNQHQRPKE